MDIHLVWKGGMIFEGSGNSGFPLQLDTDESVGGSNRAARPMEFIALGLAGCTGMDVISILRKKQEVVLDFQIKIHLDRAADHPKVFTEAVIDYHVRGRQVSRDALTRAIELSATKYCPAYAMLSKSFPTRFHYTIYDEAGNQTTAGDWIPPG